VSVYIYILMVIVTVFVSCEVIDQSERRMVDHVIGSTELNRTEKSV